MYFSSLHGHGTSSSPGVERRADRVHAGHEVAVVAEHVERGAAHAGHDPHRDRDVGGVGQLDADVGDRRAERAHRERHDVHRAPAHAAREQVRRGVSRISAGSRQLLVGPASSSRSEQMNVRSSTRATSPGSEQREVGVRAAWRPRAARTCRRRRAPGTSRSYSSARAVAPVDVVGLASARRPRRPRRSSFDVVRRGGGFGELRSLGPRDGADIRRIVPSTRAPLLDDAGHSRRLVRAGSPGSLARAPARAA